MKKAKVSAIMVLIQGLMFCLANICEAEPMGTAFTYQGRLIDSNSVADRLYDFQFALFDDPIPGVGILQGYIDVNDLDVIDGYFTVELDFNEPNAFTGDRCWLEVAVRPGDSNDPKAFVKLSPRQEVTPTPYALYAKSAGLQVPIQVSGSFDFPAAVIEATNTSTGNGYAIAGIQSDKGTVGYVGGYYGIYGRHDGGHNYGYLGGSDYGVYGRNINENHGYLGSDSYGVYGSSISGVAGYFTSSSGHGLIVESGNVGIGTTNPYSLSQLEVANFSTSDHARAVYGRAWDNGNVTNYGGYFTAAGIKGRGVYGSASASSGIGVYGIAGNPGDFTNYGGYFLALGSSGRGIYGNASGSNGIGVYGESSTGIGGYFTSNTGYGLIVDSGNVGIGTTNPPTVLALGTRVDPIISVASTIGNDSTFLGLAGGGSMAYDRGSSIALHGNEHTNKGTMWFRAGWDPSTMTSANDGDLIIETADTERFRIDIGGNVGIGTTSPASKLHVAGGCITGSMCSDIRLKKNIEPLPSDDSILDRVMGLQAVTFEWKHRDDGKRQIGLIAQDVEILFPEVVTTPDDDTCEKGLLATGLDAVLVEAIKELKAENELLKDQLKAQNLMLKKRLDALEKMIRQKSFSDAI
ncbi:MAG: tail fiber domain-containing protein [Phycisphaerae bacterium]|nr:tail fiber domain-containing protein [Phycisphaerae bacterium]